MAWGGIEKPAARRATTHLSNSSYLLGTRWGTPKLGYGDPTSWHHTTDTRPPNCIIHRSLQHASLRPSTATTGFAEQSRLRIWCDANVGDRQNHGASPSAASTEQSQGIAQVGDAVAQLDQVTQQNAALVEESAAAAESLKQQAARMTQVMATFKLSPTH